VQLVADRAVPVAANVILEAYRDLREDDLG
jgi:hypothetical protein